jgi:endogenous inhibitor of DNA gyrase (YacG/DUF329 family)
MASDFDVRVFLEESGVGFDQAGGGRELVLRSCPACGKANKFYVAADTGKFICFHCATIDPKMRGGPIGLVMLIGDVGFREAKKIVEGSEVNIPTSQDDASSALDLDLGGIDYHGARGARFGRGVEAPGPIRIPKYMLKIDKLKFPEAWAYLASRGIPDGVIERLDAYVSGLQGPRDAAAIVGRALAEAEREKIVSVIYDVFRAKVDVTDETVGPFLRKRGLPPTLLESVTDAIVSVKYRSRVVFIVRSGGAAFGWVARDYTGQSSLKVMNSRGPFKYFCAWNFDQAQGSSEIVVCEGIVSAVKCGIHRSVATLGKLVTDEQVQLLKKSGARTAYVCLDVDAQKEAQELKRRLLPHFKNVYNVSLPPVRLLKCPACGKKGEWLEGEAAASDFACPCGHEMSGQPLMAALAKSDYKDSGDYTIEEMSGFIAEARKKDGDTLLIGSAFDD